MSDPLAERRRRCHARAGARRSRRRPVTYWCLHKGGCVVTYWLLILSDRRKKRSVNPFFWAIRGKMSRLRDASFWRTNGTKENTEHERRRTPDVLKKIVLGTGTFCGFAITWQILPRWIYACCIKAFLHFRESSLVFDSWHKSHVEIVTNRPFNVPTRS